MGEPDLAREFDAGYFERVYRDYRAQNPQRKLRFYREQVEAHRSPELPRRIHDVGCGFGLFLASLPEGWQRFGSDVSAHALERARAGLPEGRFELGGALDPPSGYRGFGVVTAFDVVEHVPDVEAVAYAVDRQLLPGGLFLFVVPVYDGISGPVITRLDRDPTHLHKWPRDRWLDWASRHFEVLAWQGVVRFLLPLGYYLHVPTRRLRRHVPAICVACRTVGG